MWESLTGRFPVGSAVDEARPQRDWPAGAEISQSQGMDATCPRPKTATARLEHQPGIARQIGSAIAPGAGLRTVVSSQSPRRLRRGFAAQKFASQADRASISGRQATGPFPGARGKIGVARASSFVGLKISVASEKVRQNVQLPLVGLTGAILP